MTSTAIERIICPACGFRQEFQFYESINALEDPGMVEKLFAGEINLFICASCGHKVIVEVPLLYNDIRMGLKIQYFPSVWLEEKPERVCKQYIEMLSTLKAFRDDFGFMTESMRNQTIHVVSSMEEMVAQIKFRTHLHKQSG